MFDNKQAPWNEGTFNCDDCHFGLSSHVVLRQTFFGNAFFKYKSIHHHPDTTICACMNIEIIPLHNGGL